MSARTYIGSVRVALLDDHALVLKGLVAHLKTFPSIVVVGSAGGSQAFRALLGGMPVDVALIDYSLADDDADGISLVKSLRASFPRLKLIVVSAHDNGPVVRGLLLAGANGFVGKGQDPDDIVRAIDSVMTGRVYVPPGLEAAFAHGPALHLSPKEHEVIRCLLEGLSVTQIAEKFGRSLKTISAQKSSAFRKLAIESDVELFKMSHHLGALDGGHDR